MTSLFLEERSTKGIPHFQMLQVMLWLNFQRNLGDL